MEGLVIWAHNNCRSTLAFYLELGKAFAVPTIIYIVHKSKVSLREKVGFSKNELNGSNIYFINDDEQYAFDKLMSHKKCNHLFASYQKMDIFSRLISKAIEKNITYAIASEAPCNMEPTFLRRILKSIYIKSILPYRVRKSVQHADFMLNYSGYYETALDKLGWKKKIVSCGYYPPPIPNSRLIKRSEINWNDFTILLTGIHQWHRSPIVLLKALHILQKKGVRFRCIITQEGPLLKGLKQFVARNAIRNVEFLGFVPMNKLIELYQTCSVYVGSGISEPWGMRLNDVLQCGAPLIVSRGMGGVKLVDDYNCGFAFKRADYIVLADRLELMISDLNKFLECAENAYQAALAITPYNKANEVVNVIRKFYPNWI